MRTKRINQFFNTTNTSLTLHNHTSNNFHTVDDDAQEQSLINRSLMSRTNHKNLRNIDKAQNIIKEAKNFSHKRVNLALYNTHHPKIIQKQSTEQMQNEFNKQELTKPKPANHINQVKLRYSANKKVQNQTISQNLNHQDMNRQLTEPQPQQLVEGEIKKSIIHIDFNLVKNYFQSKIDHFDTSVSPQKIYRIINPFYQLCGIKLSTPTIKKYKNCSYFGAASQPNSIKYEGFLIYHDEGKLYYGQFQEQKKSGKGTQIDFQNDTVYMGTFAKGRKIGTFTIIKPNQKYIGQISKGLYQGYGQLTTDFSIYKGSFNKGLRHGQGQEIFLKMGLTICGTFINNKFTNNNETNQSHVKTVQSKDQAEYTQRYKPTVRKLTNPQKTSRITPNAKKLTFQVFDCDFIAETDEMDDDVSVIKEKRNAFRIKAKQGKRSYSQQKKQEKVFKYSTLNQ